VVSSANAGILGCKTMRIDDPMSPVFARFSSHILAEWKRRNHLRRRFLTREKLIAFSLENVE
jgi:hypothetical protein